MTTCLDSGVGSAFLLAALVLLPGCDRAGDTRSTGKQVDAAVAKATEKIDAARADLKRDAQKAQAAASAALGSATDTAITAGIKGSLAADAGLGVLDIGVTTDRGRVVLRGTAPDAAARDRAGTVAMAVHGVLAVDNELTVKRP